MKSKKSILIFVDYYEPGYKAGGPIRSISGLVSNLKKYFDFYIVSRDRDLNSNKPYNEIIINQWSSIEEDLNILYLSPSNYFKNLKLNLEKKYFDWIYLNSFFSFKYSIIPYLYCKLGFIKTSKVLIAPRGEFESARLAVKPRKKKLYLAFSNFLNLYSKNYWHATSLEEEKNIIKIQNSKHIFLAPNLSKINNFVDINLLEKNIREIKIVFLSRIISYKNLEYAIRTLNKLNIENNIFFDIYGPIEDSKYFEKCMKLTKKSSVSVRYLGELEHHEVVSVFSNYHLFFFPTLGENYGHVITEAFMAGCPVLISDQTPWIEIDKKGVGWAYDLNDSQKFEVAIKKIYYMNQEDFNLMRYKILDFANNNLNNIKYLNNYERFFSK